MKRTVVKSEFRNHLWFASYSGWKGCKCSGFGPSAYGKAASACTYQPFLLAAVACVFLAWQPQSIQVLVPLRPRVHVLIPRFSRFAFPIPPARSTVSHVLTGPSVIKSFFSKRQNRASIFCHFFAIFIRLFQNEKSVSLVVIFRLLIFFCGSCYFIWPSLLLFELC